MKFNSKHHRKPRSIGGTNDSKNISMVNEKMHNAWHTLFKNKTPCEIAILINKYWLDPDFTFVCVDISNKPDN